MSKHKLPETRTTELLDMALALAVKHGYLNITREQIASAAGVSPALVSHYLGTMPQMRRKIVRQAASRPVLVVLGQAVAARDSHALKAPEALRKQAVALLA